MYETWVNGNREGGLVRSLKAAINKCSGKSWVIDCNTKRIVHIQGFNKNYEVIL